LEELEISIPLPEVISLFEIFVRWLLNTRVMPVPEVLMLKVLKRQKSY
jgi:hypothetical protein